MERNLLPDAENLCADEREKNHWQPAHGEGQGAGGGGASIAFGAEVRMLKESVKISRSIIQAEGINDCAEKQ